MAKITSGFLTCASGRIGGHTLYVSGGQQIIYERSGRKRTYTSMRHYELSDAMRLAQRWRKQLADEGVSIEVTNLLNWIYAAQKVGMSGESEILFDSLHNAWSPSKVSIKNGKLFSNIVSVVPSGYRLLEWFFGEPIPSTGYYDFRYVASLQSNAYANANLICSIIGDKMDNWELIVGKFSHNELPVYSLTFNIPDDSLVNCFFAIRQGENIIRVPKKDSTKLPNKASLINISGWREPLIQFKNYNVAAWAVIGYNGEIIDMAAINSGAPNSSMSPTA